MIISICGAIGSGKSFTQLKVGLEYAERKQKQIITNFVLDIPSVYHYARLKNYKWIQHLVTSHKGISWFPNPKSLQALLLPESVCLLDEAGVFLNSREFAKTPAEFLADLAQSRKFGCDLIYCAQFDDQVDRQCRMLTQHFYHCDSLSVYDKALRRPSLKLKKIYKFDADKYKEWVNNPKARSSHLRTRFAYAYDYEGGFLDAADRQLFRCFSSFDRLDGQAQRPYLRTTHLCYLPRRLPELSGAIAPVAQVGAELNIIDTSALNHLPFIMA